MRRNDRELTDRRAIDTILAKGEVCHIAFVDKTEPYLVTLNYGFKRDSQLRLYFHCATEGRKIDIIKTNPKVCFSVDTDHELVTASDACGWGMKFKSVVGTGVIEILTDTEEKQIGLDTLVSHYGSIGRHEYRKEIFNRTIVLRLTVTNITGKQRI